jgi:DeoR/GlpR family transcriptional regulator of sugar metabolism
VEFITRHHVDRCFLGAAGLSEAGVTEAVAGFDAVKRAMMRQGAACHFLVDAGKFGRTHLNLVARLGDMRDLVTDRAPEGALAARLREAGVTVRCA